MPEAFDERVRRFSEDLAAVTLPSAGSVRRTALRRRRARVGVIAAVVAAGGTAIAAESLGPGRHSTIQVGTTSPTANAPTTVATTPPSTVSLPGTTSPAVSPPASPSSTTTATLLPQTPTSTEFSAPSGNLGCEIDDLGGPSQPTVMCLTDTPAQSVVLGSNGKLTECEGEACLSNAAIGTPTLPYGTSITLGPFTCVSRMTGMTCSLATGDGFTLARSGVTTIGSVTVTQTTAG